MMVFSWCGAIFYLTKWESRATVHDATVCPGCFGKAKLADVIVFLSVIFLLNIILGHAFLYNYSWRSSSDSLEEIALSV